MVARRRDIINWQRSILLVCATPCSKTIANSFKVEAGNTSDVSAALFRREAEQGMRLLQILDRQYAVVVTIPPYMGEWANEFTIKEVC